MRFRGVHALERRFHAFEKGIKKIIKRGIHIYVNNIIRIIGMFTLL